MSISHHPEEPMLAAYAAGALDLGQRVAIATHLTSCAACRRWARSMERVGGALLAEAAPATMSDGALARALARLDEAPPPAAPPAPEAKDAPPLLPHFVKAYRFGGWRWVAPRVSVRPIALPEASATRVFLLRAGGGTGLLRHAHTGIEMTCVLTGAFSHAGGRFGPGDFELADEEIHHEPRVDGDEECICLVAMQGRLQLEGVIGRLMQPFVRI